MAKIKFTIADPVEVPGPMRDFYEKSEDGAWHLALEGDSPKLKSFRENNLVLMKERDALKAEAEADKAKLAELLARPDATARVTELESLLASTQLSHAVATQFLASGGRPNAVEHVAAEAAKVFRMEGGTPTSSEFSASNPAEPLSIKEWLDKQAQTADYLFLPSRGSGAPARSTGTTFATRSASNVLKNPSAQDLGKYAKEIASGKIRVEHS